MFDDKMFNVEHALVMYATGYVVMPASSIYDKKKIDGFAEILKTCHIYIIGLTPNTTLVGSRDENSQLITCYEVAGKKKELCWTLPPDAIIRQDQVGSYIEDAEGEKYLPNEEASLKRLSDEQNAIGFEVLYIGQAYGEDGSRNALDRLLKHETLQKISLEGPPEGYFLNLLLLQIEPNMMLTFFNPHAKNKDEGAKRISDGIDKLFDTNEAERVTLYEASLIRYFQPKYNKEFKYSFPSTNMKLMADCYDKDFSALVAEISIDEFSFKMFSDAVSAEKHHIAKHDLHDDEDRKIFFS